MSIINTMDLEKILTKEQISYFTKIILKKNENTIKTWLSRGRELLKEKLKGGFENE